MIPMVRIEPGTFRMGDTRNEGWPDERPVHLVTITRPFLLGETPVTQKQWRAIMGSNPSKYTIRSSPVTNVSWFDAIAFCNALSRREDLEECYAIDNDIVTTPYDLACRGYRLPTEAEWEYAARAGTDLLYAGSDDPEAVGWIANNAQDAPHPVKKLRPNAWGLYDMTGNIADWCWDRYEAYQAKPAINPQGATRSPYRVYRGGSWYSFPSDARVSYRLRDDPAYRYPYLGLRVARTLEK